MANASETKDSLLNKLLKLPYGELATSFFYLSAIGGIGIAISFDVEKPFLSLSSILISNYFATYLRNVHYWASHLFLVFSIFHIIEHLIKRSDQKVKSSIWLHLTFSIFFIFYVMLSGFLLKGDNDSLHAFKIFSTITKNIPLIGDEISYFLLGEENKFQIIYFQHIATATIILLFIIIEHSRLFFPRYDRFLFASILTLVLSFILTPLPNDVFSSIIKGPWYLVGLQEFLHWFSNPEFVISILILFSIIFYSIKFFNTTYRKFLEKILAFFFLLSIVLTCVGLFFRSENWELTKPSYKNVNANFELFKFLKPAQKKILITDTLKFVEGRAEGCLNCHKMKGLTSSHSPEKIGCFSCHRGNVYTLNKSSAHSGMILIPGNLSNAKLTCGNSRCHPDLLFRVENSIMSTLSGMISVDKFAFDELKSPQGKFHVKDLKFSPAETHLRNLCVSCHLGNEKSEFGKIDELSRGGGCLACHLNYDRETETLLSNYKKSKEKILESHPSIDLKITNDHCFGCHSRSGRISTNYEGWAEILPEEIDFKQHKYRLLKDGRVFIKTIPDIHFEAGMDCIDCHISLELMGDGNTYDHKEHQVKISCENCHSDKLEFISINEIDFETKKILSLRDATKSIKQLLVIKGTKIPYTNKIQIENGKTFFFTKNSNRKLELKKPLPECTSNAHKNLSCESCHSSWVYRCNGCHTKYNPMEERFDLLSNKLIRGSWVEIANNFQIGDPTLGIIKSKGKEKISTFIPGMILKISTEKSKGIKFKRLFAPTSAHTIRKESKDCKSCHNSSIALGYGSGELKFLMKSQKMKVTFIPSGQINPIDMLPDDAWIRFMENSNELKSTRTYASHLSRDLQKKIIRVGLCLTCHNEKSRIMKDALKDFNKVLKNLSNKCLLPEF